MAARCKEDMERKIQSMYVETWLLNHLVLTVRHKWFFKKKQAWMGINTYSNQDDPYICQSSYLTNCYLCFNEPYICQTHIITKMSHPYVKAVISQIVIFASVRKFKELKFLEMKITHTYVKRRSTICY